MKKIVIFVVFILVSITSSASVGDRNAVAVNWNYPSNSVLFIDNVNVADSDDSSAAANLSQRNDAPSAVELMAFALFLGFLGFRMKNSV